MHAADSQVCAVCQMTGLAIVARAFAVHALDSHKVMPVTWKAAVPTMTRTAEYLLAGSQGSSSVTGSNEHCHFQVAHLDCLCCCVDLVGFRQCYCQQRPECIVLMHVLQDFQHLDVSQQLISTLLICHEALQ